MNYPKHVALIPDGNRTWAKEKWFMSFVGHLEWFNKAIEITQYIFSSTPIEVFTIWWLSTENLTNRSEKELEYLFELYKKIPQDLFDFLKEKKVNFKVAWNKDRLPDHLIDFLNQKEEELKVNSWKTLVLAINYGGQDELLRWIQKLCDNQEKATKENLEKYLDFGWLPPVELVIRTKQKLAKRLSWFMLWWIWYAQLYFSDLYCPDFTIEQFQKAIEWYSSTIKTQNFWK